MGGSRFKYSLHWLKCCNVKIYLSTAVGVGKKKSCSNRAHAREGTSKHGHHTEKKEKIIEKNPL